MRGRYQHDTSQKARFGILPRTATSEVCCCTPRESVYDNIGMSIYSVVAFTQASILWVECLTSSAVFHFANAWEEPDGHHIRVYGCASPTVDIDELDGGEESTLPSVNGAALHIVVLFITEMLGARGSLFPTAACFRT